MKTQMTNAFIKKTVLDILDTTTHYTAEQFIRNGDWAFKAIQALTDMDYRVEFSKGYDGEYIVMASRYSYDDENTVTDFVSDSAFAYDEILTRAVMVVLIKVNVS